MASSGADAARAAMFAEVLAGSGGAVVSHASTKSVLGRGCDPIMAEHSKKMMPPLLGGCTYIATSNDEAFFAALTSQKFDVVFFAPGACRWSAAKLPIPGGNAATAGWSLAEYRKAVVEAQGKDVKIVETTEEKEMVPLLRKALGLV